MSVCSSEDEQEDYIIINQSDKVGRVLLKTWVQGFVLLFCPVVPLSSSVFPDLCDLEAAILSVKSLLLETEVESEQRRDLVHKLIRLRIRAEDMENKKLQQQPGITTGQNNSYLNFGCDSR